MREFWGANDCIIGQILEGGSEYRPTENPEQIIFKSSAYCWIDTICDNNSNDVRAKINDLKEKNFIPYLSDACIRGTKLIVRHGKLGKINEHYPHPFVKAHHLRNAKIFTKKEPYIIGFIDPTRTKEVTYKYNEMYKLSEFIKKA